MDLFEYIKDNNEINTLLMQECDICFYKQTKDVEFLENNEIYSMKCKAFARDASGGEYVFLDDESIGFIGSEGEVGRIAESLEELLNFLISGGSIFDFNCKQIYQNESLLKAFCTGYISKAREEYHRKDMDLDNIRGNIANVLSLCFDPDKLPDMAMSFYKAALREPAFTCKYMDGEDEYICDSILSDNIGLWITELTGMTKEEIESGRVKG
ncbi:hypothetical protein LSA36186_07090 [Lachnoanaerobaculum sp. JCM 36186]|uniref:hypothetical protein n=1 Tax=Lachnoanaerobaculum sanguinis TaxID=3065809 RepID=UPI002751F89F|nr:hypothetical protein [Lachnoanaerobaculum sp. JCM 36186]GMO02460.1 hypothetical protein LSA36186_07090 [Lachnoanaerobaculum sp. JCM 36186]